MADFQLLPLPTVQNDLDIFWPPANIGHDVGNGAETGMATRYSGISIPAMWTSAGNVNLNEDPRFSFCTQVFSNGAGATGSFVATGFQFRPVLLAGGPSVTYQYPQHVRIWRLQVVFQLQVAAISDTLSTFLGMVIGNGGGPPNAPGNGYFGLILDNTGAWRWVSRVTGVLFGFTENIPNFLPGVSTPHTLDLVMFSARGGVNGQLQVYLDGNYSAAPALVRNWGPGSTLPTYFTTGKANGMSFVFGIWALDPAHAVVVQMLSARCMSGQFTPQGSQLL